MAKFFTDETPFRASDAQNELEVSILGLSAGGLSIHPLPAINSSNLCFSAREAS